MGCCSAAAGILWRVGCIALLRSECHTRHPKCVLKAKGDVVCHFRCHPGVPPVTPVLSGPAALHCYILNATTCVRRVLLCLAGSAGGCCFLRLHGSRGCCPPGRQFACRVYDDCQARRCPEPALDVTSMFCCSCMSQALRDQGDRVTQVTPHPGVWRGTCVPSPGSWYGEPVNQQNSTPGTGNSDSISSRSRQWMVGWCCFLSASCPAPNLAAGVSGQDGWCIHGACVPCMCASFLLAHPPPGSDDPVVWPAEGRQLMQI